jgi:hypothetical protein
MIDNAFRNIERRNLVDWGVVLHGATGVPGFAERLSDLSIRQYANDELGKIAIGDPQLDAIVGIATETYADHQQLRADLEKICRSRAIDLSRSLRVWRVAALEDVLANLSDDAVYGLIGLTEFWSAWGWPDDAPSSMRTNAEQLPEPVYHSRSNYDQVIDGHRKWLTNELKFIQ